MQKSSLVKIAFLVVFILIVFIINAQIKFPTQNKTNTKIETKIAQPDDPKLISEPRVGTITYNQVSDNTADFTIQAFLMKAEQYSLNKRNIVILTLKEESNGPQRRYYIALPKDLESVGGQRKLTPNVFLEKKYYRIKIRLRYKSENISSETFFRINQLVEWEPLIFYVQNEDELFK